jgi:GGDEF domain-containing protein
VSDPGTPATRDPYRTVLEVGTTLSSSLAVDEVIQTITKQVGEALDVQWCDINEYDPVARTMTYAAVWSEQLRGVDLDYLGTVVSLDERPERDAVIRKGDLLEQYVDDDDLDPIERELMIEYDEKAVMEMPLEFGGQTIGVLGVIESRRSRHFTDDEKRLFRLLAGPAATAIGNARLFRRQQEQARRMATLIDSSRALAASVDLDEVLAAVARLAAEAVDAAYATVYEYRPHLDAIVYKAESGGQASPPGAPDDALGMSYPLADLPGERAILAAESIVQQHVSDPDLPADRRRTMLDWGQKTCLSLPLRAGGSPQGILRCTTTGAERRFSADEIEVLVALGESAGAAIHNARLFRAQAEESERLLGLFEVSRRLTATFDLSAAVAAAEEGAARLLGDGRARVWLRDEDAGLTPAAGDPASAPPASAELALLALADVAPHESVSGSGSGFAVPLAVRDRVEGVIAVEAEGWRSLTTAEREALQVLANQAAAMLENVRLYRRTEQQAIRDGLTGLYNHRHFQERLRQECLRARRYGTPLSLLILDLDGFKAFNDEFGHQIGDDALREIGEVLSSVTRRGVDLAARYGGEEFAVILPHTRAADVPAEGEPVVDDGDAAPPPAGAGALVVAERVRVAIAEHAFPGHGGRRYARLTATVGVAELGADDEAATLAAAADAALYRGKRAGRDRVVADDV